MATATVEPIVKQLRYYGFDNALNVPQEDNSWMNLSTDGVNKADLLTSFGAAVKIGIQTLPGVRFFINEQSNNDGIIIDHTGVYELDLRNTTTAINNLYFDAASLQRINEIDNASIIIDLLCNPRQGMVNS